MVRSARPSPAIISGEWAAETVTLSRAVLLATGGYRIAGIQMPSSLRAAAAASALFSLPSFNGMMALAGCGGAHGPRLLRSASALAQSRSRSCAPSGPSTNWMAARAAAASAGGVAVAEHFVAADFLQPSP